MAAPKTVKAVQAKADKETIRLQHANACDGKPPVKKAK
jgi:hypothetical protein